MRAYQYYAVTLALVFSMLFRLTDAAPIDDPGLICQHLTRLIGFWLNSSPDQRLRISVRHIDQHTDARSIASSPLACRSFRYPMAVYLPR